MEQILKLFLGDYPKNIEVGTPLTDVQAMRLAIAEAWRGAGRVSPNPLVGCVILSADNRFLAKGYHAQLGTPHAEANAIANLAGVPELARIDREWDLSGLPLEKFKDARVFVTLEPCAHLGRTPSCANTLAQLPIKDVVYGLQDPNPLVSGRGKEILQKTGKLCRKFSEIVESKQVERELNEVCEHFLVNFQQSRPFITLKVGTSLDGVFGLRSGESQWITGEKSRQFAQFFRGSHDAILVGRATVARDNPSMTIRDPFFSDVQKKIVVIDTKGSLLENTDLKLFRMHPPENLIWAVGQQYEGRPKIPVELIHVSSDERGLSLASLHDHLWELGIRSIFVESGGKTLSAHLKSHAADRLLLFQAPIVLGGKNGRIWSEGFEVNSLSEGVRLQGVRRVALGDDLLMTGRISFSGNE